jgi:hypothetical protein
MYGLEYALFFGVPNNKVELIDGYSHWSFPFDSRESAEAHFRSWMDTLCRWKHVEPPGVRKSGRQWQAIVAGVRVELYPRPIRFEIPISSHAFNAFLHTFNRRDFWPGQPEGLEQGWDSIFDEGDVRMNLWKLLGEQCERHGGQHSSRCDIAISDSAAVAPDAFYYREGRTNIKIEGDYFGAAPDLVAEVLSAPSRALDRGLRMEIYRRCGVEHLWLVDPACETVDVYRLAADYELQGRYQAGDAFAVDLFPGEKFVVDDLFETQSKRWPDGRRSREEPEPIPEWLLPPDFAVGLEYFFHLGHPERRWEFWNNKAHSVLAFGSGTEARTRLDHFLAEAGRWEGMAKPKPAALGDDVERAEIGRFQFTRRGRLVWLDVAVDGRRYKELLRTWSRREAWDWGEEENSREEQPE